MSVNNNSSSPAESSPRSSWFGVLDCVGAARRCCSHSDSGDGGISLLVDGPTRLESP